VHALGGGAVGGGGGRNQDTDRERLQGSWRTLSYRENGREAPADLVRRIRIVFAGDKVSFSNGEKEWEATFRLDPAANPKQIDIERKKDEKQGRGIYRLEKDTLTLCLDDFTGERPTEFASEAGKRIALLVFQRETRDKGGAAPAEAAALREQNEQLRRELAALKDRLKLADQQLREVQAQVERERRAALAARDEAVQQRRVAQGTRAPAAKERGEAAGHAGQAL